LELRRVFRPSPVREPEESVDTNFTGVPLGRDIAVDRLPIELGLAAGLCNLGRGNVKGVRKQSSDPFGGITGPRDQFRASTSLCSCMAGTAPEKACVENHHQSSSSSPFKPLTISEAPRAATSAWRLPPTAGRPTPSCSSSLPRPLFLSGCTRARIRHSP
jgi:hypothetical protein